MTHSRLANGQSRGHVGKKDVSRRVPLPAGVGDDSQLATWQRKFSARDYCVARQWELEPVADCQLVRDYHE